MMSTIKKIMLSSKKTNNINRLIKKNIIFNRIKTKKKVIVINYKCKHLLKKIRF